MSLFHVQRSLCVHSLDIMREGRHPAYAGQCHIYGRTGIARRLRYGQGKKGAFRIHARRTECIPGNRKIAVKAKVLLRAFYAGKCIAGKREEVLFPAIVIQGSKMLLKILLFVSAGYVS